MKASQDFFASCIWAVPGTGRFGGFGKYALSGWQLNGITTLRTGVPYNVLSGVDSNLDGIATDRPNLVGNPILSGRSRTQRISAFMNTAAFAHVPAGVPYGNVQRNVAIGPGFINTDLSAFKSFALWKEHSLQFR